MNARDVSPIYSGKNKVFLSNQFIKINKTRNQCEVTALCNTCICTVHEVHTTSFSSESNVCVRALGIKIT